MNHVFRGCRDEPGYEGESDGAGVEKVRNLVGLVARIRDTCPPELTTGLRFFDPQHCNNAALDPAFNDSLNNDGALDAYAESIVWRLRGVHAMVRYVEASKTFICC
jgi:hypothetical protein